MTRTMLVIFAALCFLSASALAADDPAPDMRAPDLHAQDAPAQNAGAQVTPAGATRALPLWEAGLFGLGVTQPAYPGAGDRVSRALGLPYVIYRGRYLRAERGSVGLRAFKTPRTELDVGFAASLGSHSSDIAARRGMADLGTMIEFGPRLKIDLGDVSSGRSGSRLQFPLRAVIDVSHGFVSRGIAFEPQWVADTRLPGRWFVSTSLGAMFGDKKLGDTFYGVAPGEATATRASYTASGGLIALRAGLLAAHPLTPGVRLFYLLRIESLAGAANRDSPLVRRNTGWAAGVGLSWELARSERRTEE
ncbi:MAG TPA: MipA/OmpV family protein [Gallionella sp.]|nr:MipA/OmpV family protein [Gallionella sp.]